MGRIHNLYSKIYQNYSASQMGYSLIPDEEGSSEPPWVLQDQVYVISNSKVVPAESPFVLSGHRTWVLVANG